MAESTQEMASSLYEGKFLTQGAAEDPFGTRKAIPSLADLEATLEQEEKEVDVVVGGEGEGEGVAGEDLAAETVEIDAAGGSVAGDDDDVADEEAGDEDEDEALMREMKAEADAEASNDE